jgi:plastocyanin domain-containing protein
LGTSDDEESDVETNDSVPNESFQVNVNEFVAVQFETQHELHTKTYIGKVLSIDNDKVEVQFLRRRTGENSEFFVFPPVDDISVVAKSAIVRKMILKTITCGRFYFEEPLNDIL